MLQNLINLIFCLYSQTNFLLYFLTFYKLCNFKKEFLKITGSNRSVTKWEPFHTVTLTVFQLIQGCCNGDAGVD